MRNDRLPLGDTIIPVASSAQNRVPNGNLSLGHTVPDNVQPQQNTLNVDCHNGSWNGLGYDVHNVQPTPFQPPNLPPTVQPMLPLTRSGYIFARWSDLDVHGKMLMEVPLNDMWKLAVAPLAPSTPLHPLFAQPTVSSKSNTHTTDDKAVFI
jgi:hypothetical protein